MQIGLSQECCLFHLKSSLCSSDLPLTFLGFLATAILDSFSLFYLPNRLLLVSLLHSTGCVLRSTWKALVHFPETQRLQKLPKTSNAPLQGIPLHSLVTYTFACTDGKEALPQDEGFWRGLRELGRGRIEMAATQRRGCDERLS